MAKELQKSRGREAKSASGESLTSLDDSILANADVFETDDALTIRLDIPGVEKGNVRIEVDEGNTLQVRAKNAFEEPGRPVLREWEAADYFRSFRLGEEFDKDNVHATLENGALEIRLAKREEVKPRRIEIKA